MVNVKKYYEYKLTPKLSSLDIYKEGMTILGLITDEVQGLPSSCVNRYELNVGKREIEVSLLNKKVPKKIIQLLIKYWNIESPYIIEQIA
jgi:hypothetical protein